MVNLTKEDIISIHNHVEKRFNLTRGVINEGLVEAIAERPNHNPYNHVPFPDIYSKCASIMEAIIQWHAFADGNKRTGLLAAFTYMDKNGYTMVIPLSAVRFSVLVAKNQRGFDDIRKWIKRLTAKSKFEYSIKSYRHFFFPLAYLYVLAKLGMTKKFEKTVAEWLAYDIYPQYREEDPTKTLDFIVDLMKRGLEIYGLIKPKTSALSSDA